MEITIGIVSGVFLVLIFCMWIELVKLGVSISEISEHLGSINRHLEDLVNKQQK